MRTISISIIYRRWVTYEIDSHNIIYRIEMPRDEFPKVSYMQSRCTWQQLPKASCFMVETSVRSVSISASIIQSMGWRCQWHQYPIASHLRSRYLWDQFPKGSRMSLIFLWDQLHEDEIPMRSLSKKPPMIRFSYLLNHVFSDSNHDSWYSQS